MSEERPFDVILFGATGFTGGLIAEYLATRRAATGLRFALAGRDRAKLETLATRLGSSAAEWGRIEADSSDPASLRAMARQAKVVLTTVGPYTRYGEPLVVACIDEGTDYVDLTGETNWWRMIVERHHARAVAREVLIIPACGFDCIPADMGALYCASKLPRDQPMTIDAYARASGSASGGTVASALEIVESGSEWELADPDRPPLVQFAADVQRWTVRSVVMDPWVVRRSAELAPEQFGGRLRYRQFFAFRSRAQAYTAVAVGGSLMTAAKLRPIRRVIRKLRPPGSGPTEAKRQKGWFEFRFVGRGGGREVRVHVRGGDPGYTETAKMISEAAIMLAECTSSRSSGADSRSSGADSRSSGPDSLPMRGGVVTTAAGLGLGFVARLEAAGIEFAVDSI